MVRNGSMKDSERSDSFGHHVCFAGSIVEVRGTTNVEECCEEENGKWIIEVLAFLGLLY